MVQIHQFHPSVSYGDAIGNSIQELRSIIHELGFESEIFAQFIHPKVKNIKNYSDYKKFSSPNNILILHYSIAYGPEILDFIRSLPDKKILIYHNITPPHFFKNINDSYEYYAKLGRDELGEIKNIVLIALGVSQFNEDELKKVGFKRTDILPIPINFNNLDLNGDVSVIKKFSDDYVNIITVARISPNKKIEDVIKTFYYYKKGINPKSRLFLVGSAEGMEKYFSSLQNLIDKLNLKDVYFTGHVSDEELRSYYKVSKIFITLSEHEGFCVPLLESMHLGIPVVAYNSTAIPYTIGDAGILVNEKNPIIIAELLNILIEDPIFRSSVIEKQTKHLQIYNLERIKQKLSLIITEVIQNQTIPEILYQIEGPFDSSYSLAIVNREMACALNRIYPNKIALHSTEGHGDFEPNPRFLAGHPEVNALWQKSKGGLQPRVVTRNLYPPRVTDMKGNINILNNYAWEESAFPPDYILEFNRMLDGITVVSDFVKKVLIDNGVKIPVKTIGNGVDHICSVKSKKFSLKCTSDFKFLHISSGFPRKGIDILLKSYSQAFSKKDNVSLIIKTFPNIHNRVEEQVSLIQRENPDCAEIILIQQEIEYEYLIDLYNQCDVLVIPSRGEGFGLPIAEGMMLGIPVITTGFGGQCDFCNEETAWIIDYYFKRAETHMHLDDSIWAEPDPDHLAQLMLELRKMPEEQKKKKTQKAQETINKNFKWIDSAHRLDNFIKTLIEKRKNPHKKIKLGWITSWNTKCGIASYSRFLLKFIDKTKFELTIFSSLKDIPLHEDEEFVYRCWENNAQTDLTELISMIIDKKIDVLVIQFNFGFFNLSAFELLINTLLKNNIKIMIFFHSTADIDRSNFSASLKTIVSCLEKTERLFVHSINDLNRLKEFGLIQNVALFPQGVLNINLEDTQFIKSQFNIADKKIIASYGFLLPHKGIKELIQVFFELNKRYPNLHLLLINALYPNPESGRLKEECIQLINKLKLTSKITMINEYLSDQESILLLKCADLIVFPYQNTQESSSAAIRHGIASLRPVACTPLSIFDDVKQIVHLLPGTSPSQIFRGLTTLLDDEKILISKMDKQKVWIKNHSWEVLSIRLQNIVQSITDL
jgi:glycosyltransferase involved in cell wall biosynthesis